MTHTSRLALAMADSRAKKYKNVMFSMIVCVIQPLSRTPCCNVERTARRERWGNSYAAHDFYGPRPPHAIFVKLESREYRADYHKGKEQTQDVEKFAFEHLSSTSGNEFLYYYSANEFKLSYSKIREPTKFMAIRVLFNASNS